MAVMLCRKKTIGRTERAVDRADVVLAVHRARRRECWRRVGEGDQRLLLGECGQRPFREIEQRQTCNGETVLEHVAAAAWCHARFISQDKGSAQCGHAKLRAE